MSQSYEEIAAAAETPAAADPAPPAAEAPPSATLPAGGEAGAATEAPAWQGPSQQEWEAQQQYLQQTAPFLNELQQLLAEDQGQPGYTGQQQAQHDLSTPEGLMAYVDSQVEQRYQERMGAYEPVLGQIAEREGEQMARSTLDSLASEGGEFNRDLALVAAQLYVDPQRGGMAPADALRAAADYARSIESGIREQAIKDYQANLGNAANASTELGTSGSATTLPGVPTGRDRYEQAAANFIARNSPTMPTG